MIYAIFRIVQYNRTMRKTRYFLCICFSRESVSVYPTACG